MKRLVIYSMVILGSVLIQARSRNEMAFAGATTPKFADDDWPWWRGPHRNGIAATDQDPPVEFATDRNILWRTPVPGRGHGSPIVVGTRIFLATADEKEQVQSLLCFERQSGKPLWKTDLNRGNFVKGGNSKSSYASSTPACDGERVFISFVNRNAIYTYAVSVTGDKVWERKITDYVLHQGYGASPAIYGPLVIVMGDNKGGGAVVGLDRATGEVVWRHDRPKKPNYPSPILLNIGGRDEMVLTGCNLVTSFNPLTGKTNWESPGATTECVTSAITDGKLIFTSGGYPKNHVAAMRADGSGKIEWEKNLRVYVPSMLVRHGYLYFVTDAGVAMCREAATGNEVWNSRLGGTFSASPVMVGDRIYAINEAGDAFVFKTSPKSFEKISESKLGNEVFATPVIAGGRIYLRAATHAEGNRQEFLYCIGRH